MPLSQHVDNEAVGNICGLSGEKVYGGLFGLIQKGDFGEIFLFFFF